MKNFNRSIVLLALVGGLAACQTSSTSQHDPKKPALITAAGTIGSFVGYSEICDQFRGISVDNRILAYFKSKYRDNTFFETKYRANADLAGSDFVTGLDNCLYVNASLEHTYKNKNAPKISKKFKLTDVPHTLSINWADTNRETQHLFKLSQYGKNGRTKEFELDGKRLCSVDFLFRTNISGTWDMGCSNDETGTGTGTFQFDSKTNVTTGTGNTSFGGDITFKMQRDKS